MNKPIGFENDLGDFGPVLFDGICGEPIAWGFKILRRLGEQRFKELSLIMSTGGGGIETGGHGEMNLSWFAIVKYLSPNEAIIHYGEISALFTGPKGGFRRVTYGQKTFCCKELNPLKANIRVEKCLIEVEK